MNIKPTAHLEVVGAFKRNPSRRRPQEPNAKGIGQAPEHLAEEERAAWAEVVANCAQGVFQSSDRVALEQLAVLLAESRRCRAAERERLRADEDGVFVGFSHRKLATLIE